MGSTWGETLKISLFGESHGAAIGCVIDGLPSGISVDEATLKKDMARRAAKSYKLATPRKERDEFSFLSGVFEGRTTGTPVCAVIYNENTRSRDYNKYQLRPSHADLSAFYKYKGYQDYRGGGHFSGRLTAPLVLAGSLCKQVIGKLYPEVKIGARIYSVGDVKDKEAEEKDYYLDLSDRKLPVFDTNVIEKIFDLVEDVKDRSDSVGGIVEGYILNTPKGLGDPFFYSFESVLSSLLFSVPAVKGVEFGLGFEMARSFGSKVNDALILDGEDIVTKTNYNGGINGGITNGMPILFRCAIKPTASIGLKQQSVDYQKKEEIELEIKGRHDPCIVLRVPVIIEAVSAIALLNFLLGDHYGTIN